MIRIRTNASAWSARHIGRWSFAGQAILMLVALGLSGRAWAADGATSSAPASADTTKPVIFLKQTVVTGARYPRKYYESPQAMSFLNRKDLDEQRPTVLGDALYGVPGTDNSKDSPWEQRPVLRGLGGQRVLVMMDGDALNSARGNGPHPSLVDPTQVERVEVVRGPSSVAYGSDALGGVINIITRQAPTATTGNSMRGAASIGASSADQQFNGDLQLMPQIGKLSAFISTGGRNAEDFQTPDNGKVAGSSFSDYNAIANVRYALTNQTALKAGWQLYRGHDIGIPGLAYSQPGYSQEFNFPYYNRNAASLMVDHSYAASSWFASSSVQGLLAERGPEFLLEHQRGSHRLARLPARTGALRAEEGPLFRARHLRAARAGRFAQVRPLPSVVGPRRRARQDRRQQRVARELRRWLGRQRVPAQPSP